MAKPNTTFLVNNSTNDGENTGNATGGAGGNSSSWVVVDLVNDILAFLDTQQVDGDADTVGPYPVIIPAAGSIEAPKTFLIDDSESVYDQIPLAGSDQGGQTGGNTRYVFAIYFDGATAGIPYLEAWDDNTHATIASTFLGAGTPANSTLKAIATTDAAPGATSWAGTPLAGTSSRVSLAAAALGGAQNVYFNIRQVIASTFVPLTKTDGVLTLRYLYS
ncbi:MAG: hypothetical protein WC271_15735 [Bacteroidales bacterium]